MEAIDNPPDGTSRPELDLADLLAQIRQEADRLRLASPSLSPEPPQDPWPVSSFNWPQVYARLNTAALNVAVGTTVPGMGRFRGWKRRLARWAGKMVLYLAQIITVRQRQYNDALLQAGRELADGLRHLEKRVRQQEEKIQGLEDALARFSLSPPPSLSEPWKKAS
ncbi:MAG: hypothetical protein JO112_04185 [Planctomycetes bacterium]|nr:hypothetical protein [Planctomycetota bacterium]